MVQMNFDARNYDPSTGGADVFETGEYSFQIVKSEAKTTKAGNGTMLVLEAACLDEGFAGKRLAIRLNVQNPSQQAMEIAYRDLSAICHVVGVLQLTATEQLHGRPFRVRLEKMPRSDDPNKFNNEIRAYLDMQGNAPVKGQMPGGGAPSAPSAPPAPPSAPAAPAAPAAAPAAPAPAPAAPAPAPAPAPAAAPPAMAPAMAPNPAAAPAVPPASAPPAVAPTAAPAAPPAAAPWAGQPAAPAPTAGAVPPWQQQ